MQASRVWVAVFVVATIFNAPAALGQQDVIILATGTAGATEAELKKKLEKGLEKTPNVSADQKNIDVREISLHSFLHFSKLVSKQTIEDINGKDVSIEPDFEDSRRWVFTLRNPFLDLQAITVRYHRESEGNKAKKTASISYGPKDIGFVAEDKGGEKPKVYSRRPGVYFIALDKGVIPDEFEAEVIDTRTEKKEKITGPWPQSDRYFWIYLPNFKGDLNALAATCRNPSIVGEPVDIKNVGKTVSIAVTSLADLGGKLGGIWERHLYTISFDKPEHREPKRVLLAFPLTKAQVDEILKQFPSRGMKPANGEPISSAIRKEAVSFAPQSVKENAIPVYDLSPNKPRQWYELPRRKIGDRTVYQASFEVKDLPSWKNRKEEAWYRVVAYEFDDGTPAVVSVEHSDPKVGEARLVDEEDQSWLLGLDRLIKATSAEDENEKPVSAKGAENAGQK